MTPLLSICIPTRNRAETLRLTLDNVLSEVEPLGSAVEVLVSDNASEDRTLEVLRGFGKRIRFRVRESNVGHYGNTLGLATEMAQGQFVWALGDDDLILRGGLRRVMQALESRSDAELLYLNFGWIPVPERNRLILEGDSRFQPAVEDLNFTLAQSQRLPALEDLALLPNRNAAGIFCSMFCYILPRSFFDVSGKAIASRLWDCFSTDVDDIYPLAKVLMKAFHGRPVSFVAEPCLMQGMGLWEYAPWAVLYKVVPLMQLLDYFETLGLHDAPLARMWEDFEATAGRNVARMVLDPEANQGMEEVLTQVLPRLAGRGLFWDRFFTLFQAQRSTGAALRLWDILAKLPAESLAPGVLRQAKSLQEPPWTPPSQI